MVPHTYLEHGLSVLHARLRDPSPAAFARPHAVIRPFLTLSRETAAGATTLGHELLPQLDREFGGEAPWVFLDRDLLTRALTQHQLPTSLAAYLPEDRISEIRATIGELVGLHPSLWQLEQKVSEAILQLAHVGHVILVGRAAHLITRGLPGGLHVRLIASARTRIARLTQLLHCTQIAAAAEIQRQDEARRRFVRTNFEKEADDAHNYDLVINTDDFGPAATAQLVLLALREKLTRARAAAPQELEQPRNAHA